MRHLKTFTERARAQQQGTRSHNTRVRNQPHTGGTVSELAEKLGISKSEVRRLKREGLLDAALEKLNQ